LNRIKLSREALLFDSPLYIFKSFLSVLTAYLLFSNSALIGKDMISVLFGMMLTLEPVNISGIKSGFDQIKATFLGGVISALVVAIGGVNFITVPLAVALTVYIFLKINWRAVPVVAIFTAIYMTQFIQYDAIGNPSVLLTFELRMLALGSGVLIAIFYNYLFSIFFYKSLITKRTIYLIESLTKLLESYHDACLKNDIDGIKLTRTKLSNVFSDIDAINNLLLDMTKEKRKKNYTQNYLKIVILIRELTHYYFDCMQESVNQYNRGVTAYCNVSSYILEMKAIQKILDSKYHKSDEEYVADIIGQETDKINHQNENIQRTLVQLKERFEREKANTSK